MILVCGPCSAESYGQLEQTAASLSDVKPDYFRAGLWKPRTRPDAFEGVKEQGLAWMKQIKEQFGLKIATEVVSPYTAELCVEHGFDAVWIGARTTQNPFMVEDIASALSVSNITVMVKNPLNPDVKLWLGAVERLNKHGINNIIAVHRGFSLSFNNYRQSPLWRIPLELKRIRKDLPVICDPSHIAGDTLYIKEIADNAVATGFDGLMVETHINPAAARTDAAQQLTPVQLKQLLESLPKVNRSSDTAKEERLQTLRSQIDDIDQSLIDLIGSRMELSRKIAQVKKDGNLTIFQPERWHGVVERICQMAQKRNVDSGFIKEIFEIIHQESIKEQNIIINKSNNC
ncbi:MAG: bifunctional 3-deoxy-7-phosphoheptulonate synthase/chorismate mutase type II [Bacteroidales bacterium]|nr:bifunctional 3-deoxy-7-phosphoheptulonate synthase/chorismate mutase type II [Bacteroidales bacterium]